MGSAACGLPLCGLGSLAGLLEVSLLGGITACELGPASPVIADPGMALPQVTDQKWRGWPGRWALATLPPAASQTSRPSP